VTPVEEVGQLVEAIDARVGVYFEELTTGACLEIAGAEVFPAASVIKVPILLEVYRQAQAGLLSLQEEVVLKDDHKVGGAGVLLELHAGLPLTLEDLCRLMIVVSDNTASNLLLDRVGEQAVNTLMASLGMTGSWLGRRFMEPATAERDNRMTPVDAARALKSLWTGELLGTFNEPARSILSRQQYREKIPLLLPEGVAILHKTGELDGVRHDAALVLHPRRPYLISLFTDQGGAPWQVDLGLARISRACFDYADSLR
jgi:beta-lactamase class A